MSKKTELYATLRDVLQALSLHEDDIERIIKEVSLLSSARAPTPSGDEDPASSGSGNSPGTARRPRSSNKVYKPTHNKGTPRDRRREILVNSTLQYSNVRIINSKEQSVPDLHTLLGPRTHRVPSRQRKRRGTAVDETTTNGATEEKHEDEKVGAATEAIRKIETEKLSKIEVALVSLSESEANYMKKLQVIIEEFIIPMRMKVQEQSLGSPGGKGTLRQGSKGLVRDFEAMNAFSTIENLAQISTDFFRELSLILEKWPKYGVKSPFVMLLNVASAYKEYVSNWNTIHELLGNTKNTMSLFLHDRATRSQQDLLNLLSLPLTRLHHYEAVLHEILSTLPTVHADYPGLKDAYQQLKNFVQELDNVRHRSENGACILRIMRRMVKFDGSLMEEGRMFVYEDQVTFVKTKKKHNGVMSLFSDILLFARYGHYSNNLKYKCHVRLMHCAIFANTEQDDKNTFKLKVKEFDNSFSNEKEYSFLIYTSTPEAKERWLTHLHKVVQAIQAKKVFGASLLKCKEMPVFLRKLLLYLNNSVTDMSDDEFLRVNSGTTQIQKIKQDADSGKNVEFPSPSLAASLLKLYLRELPEALLAEMRCWFLELAGEDINAAECNKFYKLVISSLPRLQKEILSELMKFFSDLTKPKNPPNKITPRAIGITFGSNLFYGKGDVEPADLQLVSSATEYMVAHYSELFETPA